jgi:hypothetical protein
MTLHYFTDQTLDSDQKGLRGASTKVLCYLFPTASTCLSERSQRLFSVPNPLAYYLEHVLDWRWFSLACLEEEKVKCLVSGKHMSTRAALVSKLNQCNNEWCIASTITAASQMEDIKKWHEAIERPEDKGLVKKIESERGRELFQKPSKT